MKDLIFILFLFAGIGSSFGQAHSFVALQGSVESGSINYNGLNKALSTYNELDGSDLGKINVAVGYDAAISRIFDDSGIYAGLRFTQLGGKTTGSGSAGDLSVDAKVNCFTVESGFSLIQNNHMEIQIGFGADWRVETVNVNNGTESVESIGEFNGSISPHFQGYLFLSRKIPLAAFGRVYYAWAFSPTDYSKVYNSLNQGNSYGSYDDMKSRANAFGLSVGIAIVFHERDHSFTRGSK